MAALKSAVSKNRLSSDLEKVLEMAIEFYQRLLAKDPARLVQVEQYLAPHKVIRSDFKNFRIGYAPAIGEGEEGGRALYSRFVAEFENYPRLYERFVRLGLFEELEGRPSDFLAGTITFPVLTAQGRPVGLLGLEMAEAGRQQWRIPPGLDCSGWLFGLDKAAYGLADFKAALVVDNILSFFHLYSILAAIGIPIVVAAPKGLQVPAMSELLSLGAGVIYALQEPGAEERARLEAAAEAARAKLIFLPPLVEEAQALSVIEALVEKVADPRLKKMMQHTLAALKEMRKD